MVSAIRTTPALPPDAFAALRRRLIFDYHKWDPQVGDTAVVGDFALVLPAPVYAELAALSESLATETLAAERELSARPNLLRRLGLPRKFRQAVRPVETIGPRVMRFDFHPARDGWRISEVNSDVPGGYIEAGPLCALFAEHHGALRPPPCPAAALVDAVQGETVALVHATAYSDDAQVMRLLADRLERDGRRAILCDPTRLPAHDAALRFFPAEWLANLPRPLLASWFDGRRTNPATALLPQAKRFPLAWPDLSASLPTWRRLLPETRDPRDIDGEGWVLKPSLGRVGEGVVMPGDASKEARKWRRKCRWWPRHWAAQRAFESVPIDTPRGPMHACVGMFVIDGKAAGVYARLAAAPPVAAEALEVATLLEPAKLDDERQPWPRH